MNSYIKNIPVHVQYPKQYEWFRSNGYGDLNQDGLLKWATVLNNIETYYPSLSDLHILDVGGGYSALTFLLSKNNKVVNIDLDRNDNWFPTNSDGTIPGLEDASYDYNNINFLEANFLTESNLIPDDHFDVVIDSCSMIHFNKTSGSHLNMGLYESSKIVFNKLKQNGIFVISSDVAKPTNVPDSEFMRPESIIEIVESVGFKLVGKSDFEDHDNLFDVKGILSIATFTFKK